MASFGVRRATDGDFTIAAPADRDLRDRAWAMAHKSPCSPYFAGLADAQAILKLALVKYGGKNPQRAR